MPIQLAAIVPHPPIILPQIGQGQEREIRATTAAYREIARRVRELSPETIVIISSHATSYADYFHISPGKKGLPSRWRETQNVLACPRARKASGRRRSITARSFRFRF